MHAQSRIPAATTGVSARIPMEHVLGAIERIEVLAEGGQGGRGDALRRPALGTVRGLERPVLRHQEQLVGAYREDLPGHFLRFLRGEKNRQRRDLRRLHHLHLLDARLLLFTLYRNRADHAAPGERRDAVRAHVVLRHVERDRLRQADDAELRRRVVRLAEVADQAGGRRHVDVGARLLRLEVGRRGARDVEGTVEVHVDDRAPFLERHIEEEAVAQDAGVVYDDVYGLIGIESTLDDPVRGFPRSDAIGAGDGLAAFRLDLVDHLLRRPGVAAFALDR